MDTDYMLMSFVYLNKAGEKKFRRKKVQNEVWILIKSYNLLAVDAGHIT